MRDRGGTSVVTPEGSVGPDTARRLGRLLSSPDPPREVRVGDKLFVREQAPASIRGRVPSPQSDRWRYLGMAPLMERRK